MSFIGAISYYFIHFTDFTMLRTVILHRNHHQVIQLLSKYSTSKPPKQLTLAILKPDLVQHPPNLAQVHKMILDNNFHIVRSKYLNLPRSKAEQFYEEHKDKFFYNRLVTFMSSGRCQPLILYRQEAISHWRSVMGPTKVFTSRFSHPNTIRGQFGLTDTRNSSHGSDSEATAEAEINFFFPEFDLEQWNKTDKEHFDAENVIFDRENFIHRPDR